MKNVLQPTAPKLGETIRAKIVMIPNHHTFWTSCRWSVELSNSEQLCGHVQYEERERAVESATKALRYWGYRQTWLGALLGKKLGWRRTGRMNDVAAYQFDNLFCALELCVAELKKANTLIGKSNDETRAFLQSLQNLVRGR